MKRTAASSLMLSLAAVVGCNRSDSDYVPYSQTSPSQFEQDQQHTDLTPAAETIEARSENTAATPLSDNITPSADNSPPTSTDPAVLQPASHGIEVNVDASTNPAATADSDQGVEDSDAPAIADTPKTIVSEQTGLTGRADTPEIDNGEAKAANKIELLIPYKSFRRERGTDAVRVSYDDIDLLKVLNMEPVPPNAVEYFPEWLAALNGRQIRIRGFMYPKFVSEGITTFTLARDNGICCFQRMPKIYDVIYVKLEPGRTTDYIDARPFDVEGTFHIDTEDDGSELPRLYKIDNARILE